MAPLDDVQTGDTVNVPGGMYGTVKYLGTVAGKPGKFAGIELAPEHARRGKNSGDVEGRKYFSTSNPGSGIFVPMNNSKYVTKRAFSASVAGGVPPTPTRPAVNFSKSVGPSPATRRPQVRRPSLPRPESPQRQAPTPSKLSLNGLRTPSGTARPVPSPNGFPRSPIKPPSRMSERPPSRVSTEDDVSSVSVRTSDMHQRDSMSTEIQDLKDNVKSLEKQLLERDQQLGEQSGLLSEFQSTLEELEGSDGLSIRNQLREKNERIAQLTQEFDLHRADFRSTLDTLEIAASETERVYEQRLEELLQQHRELQERDEDVEVVAQQLKQLEELVSELEEGLEDARRGEAEARAEVEFLRGEVERTKLELDKERGNSSGTHSAQPPANGSWPSKELDQKDDEIRGLKAIIHSLSRGDPNLSALQLNGGASQDPGHLATLEQRLQEYEDMDDKKTSRLEELEHELHQLELDENSHARSGTITAAPQAQHQPSSSTGNIGIANTVNHAHRLSDRTVVPNESQNHDGQHPFYAHHRTASESSRRHLETMHESDTDTQSDDGSALWCEICEANGHDILSCTSMFGNNAKKTPAPKQQPSENEKPAENENKPTPESSGAEDSETSSLSNSISSHGEPTGPQKTGRDAVLEGLKGISGGMNSSLSAVAGKSSGVIDGSKWCALCERDGHESIDCPFDD
ncbi:CAP-Gly domain containing linker protein BIK1 [Aspergillus glaucus CBS 516.65]|uniref:CAP-Gly domain-containing protein n=1 Tax=Aspergillus glaucus CBS 516.65 TaxID=1160497 RepID=A0A1L9VY54_ASPGL|nr:hypothetical protein ASPGLDRAFT_31936 [Aspergillus glaucus CBS 516.65]OJJ88832.1 hypothetical protein ASPGLDRAFT_31936 [Aspergillus glaucus CBS 516.65]